MSWKQIPGYRKFLVTIYLFCPIITIFSALNASTAAETSCESFFNGTIDGQIFKYLDSIKDDRGKLREFQTGFRKSQEQSSFKVIKSKNKRFPFELITEGRVKLRLRKKIGENTGYEMYLTENNTAVKILKSNDGRGAFLLQTWAHNLIKDSGIEVPNVIYADPEGLYLEVEYLPGLTLRDRFGSVEDFEKNPPPKKLIKKILSMREKALELAKEKNIYLDLKASNFQERADGSLILIDGEPLVEDNFYDYYCETKGKDLTDEQFLAYFFYRQSREKALIDQIPEEEYLIAKRTPLVSSSPQNVLRLQGVIDRSDDQVDKVHHLAKIRFFNINKRDATAYFKLFEAFWQRSFNPEMLRNQVKRIAKGEEIGENESKEFKRVRRGLKRVRSVLEALGENHKSPHTLDQVVKALGNLRDFSEEGKKDKVRNLAKELNSLLSEKSLRKIGEEFINFRPANRNSINNWIMETIELCKTAVSKRKMTADDFHEIRKGVSALLALAEGQYAVHPKDSTLDILMFLRSLNKTMARFLNPYQASVIGENRHKTEKIKIPAELQIQIDEFAHRIEIMH